MHGPGQASIAHPNRTVPGSAVGTGGESPGKYVGARQSCNEPASSRDSSTLLGCAALHLLPPCGTIWVVSAQEQLGRGSGTETAVGQGLMWINK